jgi:hypothetical protein
LDRMQQAIRVLSHHGRAEHAARIATRAGDELRARGYDAQAAELAEFADGALGPLRPSRDELRAMREARSVGSRGSLPGRCGGCGAPLIPDDVAWHDAQTAECPYCGAVIKAS